MKQLIHKYFVYIIYFLGIGMTSSGIVLMPFNPLRYSIILFIGLSLFITGSMFNEIVIDKHKMSTSESIKLICLSLFLAIGIGMISGGISHFKESPLYVSYLIPLGIMISFTSFSLKNKYILNKRERIVVSIGVLVVSLTIFISLNVLANNPMFLSIPLGGDIFMDGH